jgi:hypothetical protein
VGQVRQAVRGAPTARQRWRTDPADLISFPSYAHRPSRNKGSLSRATVAASRQPDARTRAD